ncbi:3-deoxy-7-phosphoheptulonate synthase [Acetomicrobium sp.]|uniref:3-deoxy-7-phosphoheptulonate synthase n=1 Tax=Acetomicrobium sp. TaxID=1872099 RepID=UPI001BCF5CA0|nr:3-deoxy-7-phosphoheptulonate synthase [Acetomicrobium sp.]
MERAIVKTKRGESAGRLLMKLDQIGIRARIAKEEPEAILLAEGEIDEVSIKTMPEVDQVTKVKLPFSLASREWHKKDSIVNIAPGISVGGGNVLIIAGPCAVEGKEQIVKTAQSVKRSGALALRGGAYKPRTNPYTFQGLGIEGLALLAEAKKNSGLPIVTEIMTPEDIDFMLPHTDILQVGSRNMQNFSLLKALGKVDKPVLLKRGMMATIDEWLQAAEYIMAGGNFNVILCERGIRSFEKRTRNTLDLNAVPLVKSLSHLPVIVDPSHGTGKSELVPSMSLAALAAGADGLIVEVHPNPQEAVSDGDQSLDLEEFDKLMKAIKRLLSVIPEKTLEGSKCSVAA